MAPAISEIASSSPTVLHHTAEIHLNEVEDTLRRLLLDVVEFTRSNPPPAGKPSSVDLPSELAHESTVLRFTGGWVRDRLLGIESHDIDVAINNMTGEQFGLRMKEYLEDPANSRKYGLEGVAETDSQAAGAGANGKSKLVGGLHKIEANPEKSKHLETVTTKILGLDIDLVNLRKETYSDTSRNPQIQFGTPEEDALRRDATINAMFYNLNTAQVEDFTGQGMKDLKSGIIRTPLEAYQTFKDDPLRILRLIRFASRLDYKLDSDAAQSMRSDDIKASLKVKISRERVGVELEKMLRGPRPLLGLQMIDDANLYNTIFCDPTSTNGSYVADLDGWRTSLGIIDQILGGFYTIRDDLFDSIDADDRFASWILACLTPYQAAPQPKGLPGRKPPPPIATNVAREGFKATNKICELLTSSVRNSDEIRELVKHRDWKKMDTPEARETLGMAIRRWGVSWRLQVLFSLFGDIKDPPDQAEDLIEQYAYFVIRIRKEALLDANSFRPLLDGKQLSKGMGVKTGPWMKDALDVVMQWQLRDPNNKSIEEAIERVKQSGVYGELTSDLIKHFLSLTIRPLFIKSRLPTVTNQGRKNTSNVGASTMDLSYDEEDAKPWKDKEHQVVDILGWVIGEVDQTSLEQNWHLLVPPLLTMLDDHEVKWKTEASQLLRVLLQKTPPRLLAKTGLFDVFRDALAPCLGFLPTLTPEEEATPLLASVFPALMALSQAALTGEDVKGKQSQVSFLDYLLRKGVLATQSHCSDYPRLLTTVFDNLVDINDALGLDSIKHLRAELEMLNEVLCNPFGTASPELMVSALRAVQSIIRNAWPRIREHRLDVLKGVLTCWSNASESADAGKKGAIKEEAKVVVSMLKQAIGPVEVFQQELTALVEADGRLATLLQ